MCKPSDKSFPPHFSEEGNTGKAYRSRGPKCPVSGTLLIFSLLRDACWRTPGLSSYGITAWSSISVASIRSRLISKSFCKETSITTVWEGKGREFELRLVFPCLFSTLSPKRKLLPARLNHACVDFGFLFSYTLRNFHTDSHNNSTVPHFDTISQFRFSNIRRRQETHHPWKNLC